MARPGRKKRRTHIATTEEEKVPRSFVLKYGAVSKTLGQLVRDTRNIMEPNTAIHLRERRKNKLRDYIDIAGPLGVTHFMVFANTGSGISLRLGRIPRGPTLSFKVESYTLTKDIRALQARPVSSPLMFKTAPLVVLNNFKGDEKHIKLMSVMFQNMFPPINVQQMKLADARRVVLFNYDEHTKLVDIRHYSITVKLAGVSKSVKSVLQTNIDNLHSFNDISDFVLKGAYASESDMEDQEATVQLPEDMGKNNTKSSNRAIRLQELGPRMQVKLIKIQEGMCSGPIIHHELVQKTPEQVAELEKRAKKKLQERDARRREQEENVKRKSGDVEDEDIEEILDQEMHDQELDDISESDGDE